MTGSLKVHLRTRRTSALAWVMLVALIACGSRREHSSRTADPTQDCELTGRRCSRCHTIDRIEAAHVRDPDTLRGYVNRMRRMPGSGIPPEEEPVITRCLQYWATGTIPLRDLTTGAAP